MIGGWSQCNNCDRLQYAVIPNMCQYCEIYMMPLRKIGKLDWYPGDKLTGECQVFLPATLQGSLPRKSSVWYVKGGFFFQLSMSQDASLRGGVGDNPEVMHAAKIRGDTMMTGEWKFNSKNDIQCGWRGHEVATFGLHGLQLA